MQIQQNQERFSKQKCIYVCINVCLVLDTCIRERNTLKKKPIKRYNLRYLG